MIELTLLIGLFYPQFGLLVGYFTNSILPNPIPFWGDFLMAIFLPRLLFIIYIALNLETLPYGELWIVAHGIGLLITSLRDRLLSKLG